MKKIILDTDIGSDIDDAVCLTYLLAHPGCDLLGITTVSGEPVERARMASAMCRVAGVDIPIIPGAAEPMQREQQQPSAPQAAALDRWDHDASFPAIGAVDFLRNTIRENPGEVTLLAIGPLTNLGHLFAADPELPALLDSLVLIGGVFLDGGPQNHRITAEWNIRCDPHAAAIVYAQQARGHRSIGLDVTMQVTMRAAEVRERFQLPLLRPVLDFAEVWFQSRETITFHDPLAAATLFRDDVCSFEHGTIAVELQNEARLGATTWTPGGPEAPHEVATRVDVRAFFSEYFDVVEGAK